MRLLDAAKKAHDQTSNFDTFAALVHDMRPDVSDEQIRAAWNLLTTD